jgi:hypothetical protein
MKSVNHQFIELNDQVVARYIKTVLSPVTGYRLNPRNAPNPNERIDFLLATPESSLEITPYGDGEPAKHKQVRISYEDEVLELYTETEKRSFERMNRLLIQNGILVPYEGTQPELDMTNVLSDVEIRKIATTKTTAVFKTRIDDLTSVPTLESILKLMEDFEDVKYAHIKYIKQRITALQA